MWNTVLRTLESREQLPAFEFQLIRNLKWVESTLNTVVLGASSDMHAAWIRDRHLGRLETAFSTVVGHRVSVKIVLEPQVESRTRSRDHARPSPERESRPEPASGRSDVMAGVVTGPEIMEGAAAVRMVLGSGWNRFNPLFFHGPSGTGKSLLMRVLYRGLLSQGVRAVMTNGDEFSHRFTTAVREGRVGAFMAELKRAEAFMMDDVHRLRGRDRTLDAFRQVFDAVYNRGGFLAFASYDYPLTDGFPEVVSSRLSWGLVVRLKRLGFATRLNLLRSLLRDYGVADSPELARRLADALPGDGRVIEGVVKRIAYLHNMGISDPARVEEEIRNQVKRFRTRFSPDDIIEAVTRYFGLERNAIFRESKARSITRPRRMAMYLVRKHTGASFPQIGELFGGKSHTTVMDACRRVEKEAQHDPQIRMDLDTIESILEGRK